jgi:serine protease DegQ
MSNENNPLTLQSLSSELADVVQRVGPSVVRVDDGSRLTATGVVWDADGLILTTSHGVEGDEKLAIQFADGTRRPATVVGRDDESDLALLRVAPEGLVPIERAADGDVQVGNLVLALGRPGGRGLQATLGIISARIEAQNDGQPEYLLHTDANLYPGFSGGPLVNVAGQIVGLTNLSFGRGQGVALGVPILNSVAQILLTHSGTARGYLGVSTQSAPLPETLRTTLGLTQTRGLLIVQIGDGSPAEAGGLQLGDLLLGIAGQSVEDADTLRRKLRTTPAGQSVMLSLVRGGQHHDLTVTLGAQ